MQQNAEILDKYNVVIITIWSYRLYTCRQQDLTLNWILMIYMSTFV